MGFLAGRAGTTGSKNVCIGWAAGFLSTGSRNTFIGAEAGRSNTGGSSNMYLGYLAARYATTAASNTVIGQRAAESYAVGGNAEVFNNSIYIGTGSKPSAAGVGNEIVIGVDAEGNGFNTVTIGNSSVTDNYFTGNLNATGAISGSNLSGANTGDQSAADVPVADTGAFYTATDVEGVLQEIGPQLGGGGGSGDVVGPASATDNAIARFDTTTGKLLQDSGMSIDDTGSRIETSATNTDVIIGYAVAPNAPGGATRNVFIGDRVVQNGSLVGAVDNIGIGFIALRSLTSGDNNVAIGDSAGDAITIGGRNVCIGDNAGGGITTGNFNVAVGSALTSGNPGSFNMLIGHTAGLNLSGEGNSGIGTASLRDVSGDSNVGIGRSAGSYLADGVTLKTTGSGNTYLGSFSESNALDTTNEIVIGFEAEGNGSNTATIGNSSVTDTYLGGTTHTDAVQLNALNTAPATATSTGTTGEIRVTATHIYVCTATDTWVRAALATW